ncbi:hypothetical protein XCR_2148 [Xanthomonas campestris pv. raphani 756C]|nr:hypothetical protein XCR_2148 [Xanthomonas campestris pv. raphani 756C]
MVACEWHAVHFDRALPKIDRPPRLCIHPTTGQEHRTKSCKNIRRHCGVRLPCSSLPFCADAIRSF